MNHLSEFMSMTQIGRLFGVSSHKIGAWLTEIGLREDGDPTHIARNGGYVTTAPNGRNDGFYWVWKTRPTIKALEQAGHRRIDQPIRQDRLIGPFNAKGNGGEEFEITGGDGTTFAWIRGELAATKIEWLLNLAFEYDRLN